MQWKNWVGVAGGGGGVRCDRNQPREKGLPILKEHDTKISFLFCLILILPCYRKTLLPVHLNHDSFVLLYSFWGFSPAQPL